MQPIEPYGKIFLKSMEEYKRATNDLIKRMRQGQYHSGGGGGGSSSRDRRRRRRRKKKKDEGGGGGDNNNLVGR